MPEERIRGSYGDVIKLCFGNLLRISIVGLLFFAFAFVACDRLPDAAAAHSARTRDDALTAEAASYFLSMDPDDMGVAPQHVAAVREAVAFSMHRKHRRRCISGGRD